MSTLLSLIGKLKVHGFGDVPLDRSSEGIGTDPDILFEFPPDQPFEAVTDLVDAQVGDLTINIESGGE